MAVPEHQMREALARYVSGEVSLIQFQEWFIPRAWEIFAENTPGTALASEIEFLLAEFTNGDWTEPQIRETLKQYAVVPLGGAVVINSVVEALQNSFWTQPAGGIFQRWPTSALGADLGDTTIDDLRKEPSPLDGVRWEAKSAA